MPNAIRYTKAVLASEELTIDLDGNTKIHISGLPVTKVNYNKKITMKGIYTPAHHLIYHI